MPRLSLEHLPRPRRRNNIARIAGSRFETEDAAQKEDQVRVRRLRANAGRTKAEQAECSHLADQIEEVGPANPTTLTSKVAMRAIRLQMAGELLRLCRGKRTYFVTLIPRGLSIAPDDLPGFDPKKENQKLRVTLNRAGASSRNEGWIFASLEGEYNPATGMVQIHYHLIVVGDGMVGAIKRLRQQPRFKRKMGTRNNPDGVKMRIQVKRVRRSRLHRAINYAIKGTWYQKWRDEGADGARKTQKCRGRIQEPTGSKVLLWLDRWKVGDMTMMLNLWVGKNGLTPR